MCRRISAESISHTKFLCWLLIVLVCMHTTAQQTKGGIVTNESNPKVFSGTARAVVVGISDYLEVEPDLQFAHRDAELFMEYLTSKSGGSVDTANIKSLLNAEATTANIIVNLEWLKRASKPGDRAYIYFSGHGDIEKLTGAQNGYLLTYNSPKVVYIAGALPVSIVKDYIATLSDQGVQTIFISDACHSGKLVGGQEGSKAVGESLKKRWNNEIKILSAQPWQLALEGKQWGGGRGLFSFHLLNGLYGKADTDADGEILLSELENYVAQAVVRDSKRSQEPVMDANEKYTTVLAKPNQADAGKIILQNFSGGNEVAMHKSTSPPDLVSTGLNDAQLVINKLLEGKQFLREEDYLTAHQKIKEALLQITPSYPLYNNIVANEIFLRVASVVNLSTDTIISKKELQQLVRLMDTAINILPEAPYLYLLKGEIFYNMSDMPGCIENLKLARQFSPKWIYPLYYLSNIYFKQKNYAAAIENLELALSIDSNLHMMECTKCNFLLLGNIYKEFGKYEKAIGAYEKAIRLDVELDDAYHNIVEIYCKQKNYGAANKVAAKIFAFDSVSAHWEQAYILLEQKKYKQASDLLEKVIEEHPNHEGLYYLWGYAGYMMYGVDEYGAFREAIRIDPSYIEPYYYIIHEYMKESDFGSAELFLKQHQKFIKDKSDLVEIWCYYLWVYADEYRYYQQNEEDENDPEVVSLVDKVAYVINQIKRLGRDIPDEDLNYLGDLRKKQKVLDALNSTE